VVQRVWVFKAHQPPDPQSHPLGTYFTTLSIETTNLAKRLRLPKRKIEYFLSFLDVGDLRPLRGGRGEFVFYSLGDYQVVQERQDRHGSLREALGEGT
jgi:hypothetical protein